MTRPHFCAVCACSVPTAASMSRRGPFWLCALCAAAPVTPCGDGGHAWRGAIDDQGSAVAQRTSVWGCLQCGAILQHQAIKTDVVEAAPETGYIDC